METNEVNSEALNNQMRKCVLSGGGNKSSKLPAEQGAAASAIVQDDPDATQVSSPSIQAMIDDFRLHKDANKWRFDYPKESEIIPLSNFPPGWWDALSKEPWAFDLIKDDLDF